MQSYQKFEYAIGHWLQKATEHVLGCVLCRCLILLLTILYSSSLTCSTYPPPALAASPCSERLQ